MAVVVVVLEPTTVTTQAEEEVWQDRIENPTPATTVPPLPPPDDLGVAVCVGRKVTRRGHVRIKTASERKVSEWLRLCEGLL